MTPYRVSLDWKGKDEIVLDLLLKQVFQVDNGGLISLTGLNPQSMQLINKIYVHQALTATLLQHNEFVTTTAEQYKASGTKLLETAPHLLLCLLVKLVISEQFYLLLKGKPNPHKSINFQVYGVKIRLYYKQLNSYINQNFSHQLCNPKTHQSIEGHIPIVSWLYPGAIVKASILRGDLRKTLSVKNRGSLRSLKPLLTDRCSLYLDNISSVVNSIPSSTFIANINRPARFF